MDTIFCIAQDYVITKQKKNSYRNQLTSNADISGKAEYTPEQFSEADRL